MSSRDVDKTSSCGINWVTENFPVSQLILILSLNESYTPRCGHSIRKLDQGTRDPLIRFDVGNAQYDWITARLHTCGKRRRDQWHKGVTSNNLAGWNEQISRMMNMKSKLAEVGQMSVTITRECHVEIRHFHAQSSNCLP